jgi:hypothetical protein
MDEKLKERKNSIISYMESLVHKRYTKQTLEQSLFDFFGKKVTLCNGTNDWDEDYRVMFLVKDDILNHIFFDIWYLELRKTTNFPDGGMYITEVGYDFEEINY